MIGASTVFALCLAAVGWVNLDDAHHVGGRKLSEGYLQGKTVLVCADKEIADGLEVTWDGFKTRPLAILCTLSERPKGSTFAVYRGAGLKDDAPKSSVYIVDPLGKVVYRGRDSRRMIDVLVSTLARWEVSGNEKDWRRAMDFELIYQPAHAICRYREGAKDFPEAAKDYEIPIKALQRLEGMADLVKLLGIANRVSEFLPKSQEQRRQFSARLKSTIDKYAFLKQSKDIQVVREAKNVLADLTYLKAEL